MTTDSHDTGISVREATRRIGCHPTRIYKLLHQGRLRGYRDGRRLRVIESSVVAYQQGNALPIESPAAEHRRHAGGGGSWRDCQSLRGRSLGGRHSGG